MESSAIVGYHGDMIRRDINGYSCGYFHGDVVLQRTLSTQKEVPRGSVSAEERM